LTQESSLDHVNIATSDAGALSRVFQDALGLTISSEEIVKDQGVRLVKLSAGHATIEITEPLGPDTPVGRFLAKRGEGLHHLAFHVPDLEAAIARLKAMGLRMIDDEPRYGAGGHRIAFAHPKSFGGVLVELVEIAP
jgi:methylmalonyl-CoA/ethylmalonyl-CoA epimerase